MRITRRAGATLVPAAILFTIPAAHAQRAASTPSLEGAEAGITVPPPPPGFPAPMGTDLVFGGEVETHFEGDLVSSTNNKTRVSLFNDTDVTGFVNYKGWLSLNTEAKLERNRDNNDGSYYVDRNAAFRSEGLTLRQLYLSVRPTEKLSIFGGKIHPGFGSAYESAPGQFYNFGTDYEQDERIGFGVGYTLPSIGPEMLGLDNIRLTAETFYLDTTSLSESLISRPSLDDPTADRLRRYTRNQFGPSNTGALDSFTVSLRGGRPARGLTWQISVTHEATDLPGGRSENGQSIGASYDPGGDGIPLSPRLGVTPFVEYAHFSNFQGIAGLERHYAIGGLAFTYGRWGVSTAAGLRHSAGSGSGTDHQENISFTYEVIPRLLVGAGMNFANVDGKSSRILAPSLSYKRAF